MRIFRRKTLSLLGMAIEADSIKILEISGQANDYCLEAYAKEYLPTPIFKNHRIINESVIISTLRSLIAKNSFKTSALAFALPDEWVFAKTLIFNKNLKLPEIKGLIFLEIEKIIQQPLNRLYMDFQILGPAEDPDLNKVLLLATEKDCVDPLIQLFKQLKLELKILDVVSYALERCPENPLKQLRIHKRIDKTILEEHTESFHLACSLAMRREHVDLY